MESLRFVPRVLAVVLLAGLLLGGCTFLNADGSSSTLSTRSSITLDPTTTSDSGVTEYTATTLESTTTVAPTTTASSTWTAALPGTNYTRIPTKDKVVALTFDAAYDPAPLKGILAALEQAGAEATFFLTGEFVTDFPGWTKEIINAGHPIGNHSYSHPDFTALSETAMRNEIEKTAAALIGLGAKDPTPLFRAPYGALDKQVLSVLGSEGYISVYWTIDTLDWKPERTPAEIKAAVLGNLKPGAIILMHVGGKQTAQVLPELLGEIERRGYDFVNLREALPGAVD